MSDAFLAQMPYRAKVRMQDLGVPLIQRLAHRLAMVSAQVSIGDPVVVSPGLYLLHGQVVIDGLVEVGPGVVIGPWMASRLGRYDLPRPRGRGVSGGPSVVGTLPVRCART